MYIEVYTYFSHISLCVYYICIYNMCGSAGKESTCHTGDLSSIPGLGKSPGEGKGYPLQYSGLENSMECIVHGIIKSWTWLSDFHFYIYIYIYIWMRALNRKVESSFMVGKMSLRLNFLNIEIRVPVSCNYVKMGWDDILYLA